MAQSANPIPRGGEVVRHVLDAGVELWIAEVGDDGPAGIDLVFPGNPGEETLRTLAGELETGCPGDPPIPAAGADYAVITLTRPPKEVPDALRCLGEVARGLREAPDDVAGPGTPTGWPAAAEPDLRATGTPAGVLLSTLYAPAAVPGGALGRRAPGPSAPVPSHLVVAGAVDRPGVIQGAEAAFGRASRPAEGTVTSASAPAPVDPRPPVSTEVLILNRPAEPWVELRAGQLVLSAEHPDWSALVVAREILSDRLRGGAWAFAELLRVQGRGAFIAGSRLPLDGVPGALDQLLAELGTLRDRLPTEAELGTATSRLSGAFAVATARPSGLADELARVAALGLGPEAVTRYPERLATLTPNDVRRAAREHLDPAALVIAGAGDGPALAAALSRFGPVRILAPPAPPTDWPLLAVDGSVLSPGASRYRVRIGGQEVGTARREVVEVSDGRVRFRTEARIGSGELGQELEASLPGLLFVEGRTTQGGRTTGVLRREGERLLWTGEDGIPVSLTLVPGTVVSDLLEPTLWASTLEIGAGYRVPVAALGGGAVEWAAVRVVGEETITVPAGRFPTLRVEVTGPEILTLWLRRDSPHRTVRLLGANGVMLELEGQGAGGP